MQFVTVFQIRSSKLSSTQLPGTTNISTATVVNPTQTPTADMWVPGSRAPPRAQRTSSVHSIASITSPSLPKAAPAIQRSQTDRSTYNSSDDGRSDSGRLNMTNAPAAWQSHPQHSEQVQAKVMAAPAISHRTINTAPQQNNRWEMATDDDASSRSSTLDGEEEYMDHVEKKLAPRLLPRQDMRNHEPRSPAPAPHVPGPLESQLAALMSKLIYIENANPVVSVTPEEFQQMQKRLKALEEEKKTWSKRHDAIWALRDEDVENNIKIRVRKFHTSRSLYLC
jgi:hypothetical protein